MSTAEPVFSEHYDCGKDAPGLRTRKSSSVSVSDILLSLTRLVLGSKPIEELTRCKAPKSSANVDLLKSLSQQGEGRGMLF